MADIVINPAIGKIDFFTTKGDNVTNTLRLTGNTLLVTGPLSASSISTGGGGAFVTSVQPTTNYLSKFTGNSTIANSVIYDNGTNVGIGSTSPTFKLDVNGSIALSGYRFADFNTYYNRIFEPAGNTAIYLGNASDPTNYSDNTNHAFRNRGGSSVYAYINSNGNLGIGTTSPGAPLTIYRASNPWIRVNGGGAFSYIQLDDGTSYGYLLKNSSSDTSNNALAGALYTYTDSGKAFQHIHSGTALFTILSGGSIGIGSAAPSYKLEVYSGAKTSAFTGLSISNFNNYDGTAASLVTSQLRFAILENPTGTYNAPARTFTILESGNEANNSSSDGFFAISTRSGGTVAEKLRLNSAGNLGIGTTNPTTKLAISDGTTIAQVNPSSGVAYFGSVNNYPVALSVNSSEKVRIISDGNVGIGSTAPAYKLEVIGDVRVSGGLVNAGLSAQWTLSGGGTATYNGSSILWNARVIAIPVERTEFGADGYIDITCPTSGTITYYNASNVTTTVTCNANGIPIANWESLYYEVTPGQSAASDQTKFRLVNYNNTTWRPSSNWLLICTRNGDGNAIKWLPGQIVIPNGGAFDSSNSTNNWEISGTTNYIARFTSANKIGNSSVLYDNGANIGIGTTSPGYKLHVVGDGYVTGNLTIGLTSNWSNINFIRSGGSTVGGFGWRSDGYFYVAGHPDYGPGAGNDVRVRGFGANLILGTNSTDYIWLNTSGNLGIGTNNPATKLQVIGGVEFGYGSNSIFYTGTAFDASNYLILQNNTDAYGRVGLTINAKTFSAANTPSTNDGWALDPRSGIRFRGWLSGDSGYDTKFVIQHLLANATNAVGDLGIFAKGYSSTVPAFVLAGGGNVGIGTTSPAYKLDVSGNARFTSDTFVNGNLMVSKAGANLYINGSNSDAEIHWQANGTSRWAMGMNVGDATENLNIYNYTTSTTNFTILKASGNVGIGSSSPVYKLDVNGIIASSGVAIAWFSGNYNRLYEPAGNPALYLGNNTDPANYYDNTTHYFRNRGGSTNYAIINSSGNLGVGTTVASYKVDVVGAVRATIDNDFSFVLKRSATNVWTGLGYYTANNSKWFVGLRETGDDNLRWYNYTNSAERMVLTEAGSLGVGTTSPGTKLDVVGEITTPVIKQSATLYSGTDITDDNSTRTVYFNIPLGGYSPPKYFKVARIKITGNYQNVSLNGYFTTTNSTGLHVGSERKVEFDFIAYAATNPGAPTVTYLKRGPDTTNVLVYAVPNGGGAGTTYYDVYIKSAWYNDTNGELAVRVGYSSAVTIWQAGLDSGTSAPTDTLVNPNSSYSFDTSGNIGIGTTSPAYKLDVYGPVSLRGTRVLTTGFDIFGGLTYDIYGNIRVLRSDSAQADGMYIGYGGSGGPLRFFSNTGVQEFMTIATTGNVGIGSTSPAHRLDVVSGSIRASSGAYAGELYFGTNSNADLYLKRDNGYDLSLVQNASSGNALYLAGAGNVYLSIDSNNNETDRAFIVQNNSIKSGTELFRVNEAGSVGIGTSSPGYKLDVGAVGSNSVSVRLTPGYERVRYYGFDLLGYNDGNLWMIGNNATNALILGSNWDWDSQIAIAYTPGTFGAGGGTLELGQVTKNNANFTHGNTRFYTNGIERLRIISSGNVGVGTTSPTAKFQVGTHSTGDAGNGDNSANVRIGAASAGARVFGMTLANTAAATLSNESALSFVLAGNYSATGIISALLRSTGNAATDLIFTNYNGSLQERMRILYDGNVGIGTSAPAYKLDISGTGFASSDFRAPIFYDSANTAYYVDPASTSNLNILSVTGYQYINGQTLNGQSFYQWEGATYRNPGDHTPQLLIRKDNSTTGINGFAPALALYNNNGADQTTVGMTFVSAEAVSPTQGNSVELAGIIAKKESTGTAGGWSRGSLNFYTKDYGTRKDVMQMSPDGNVAINTTDYTYTKNDNSRLVGTSTNNRVFISGSIQLLNNNDAIVIGRSTATFLSDEELGFGWGGGWYMTDGTYLRVRNDKTLYSGGEIWGSVFKDSANTAYYVDPASSSNVNNLTTAGTLYTNNIAKNANGSPIVINSGQNAALGLRVYYDMQVYNTLFFTDSSWNNQGAIFGSGGNVTINAATATTSFIKYAGYSQEGGSFRAPIFYDSDNTSYYLDPSSTSNLVGLTVANTITGNITGNSGGSSTFVAGLGSGLNYDIDRTTKKSGLSHYSGYSTGTNRPTTYDYTLQVTDGNKGWEISMDWIATTGPAIYARSLRDCCQNWSTWVRILDSANYTYAANMNQYVRTTDNVTHNIVDATQFRDSANTAYYVDPASTSVLNYLSLSILNNMNPANGTWHTSAEGKARFYFASNSNTYFRTGADFIYRNNSDSGVLVIDSSGNLRTTSGGDNSPSYSLHVGGTGYAVNDFRAPIFYDSNNTSYYLDPASTTTSLQIAGAIEQGNDLARPLVQWGASGDTTGMIVIKLPGTSSNYGMIHAVIDIYEYSGANVSTIIVGGHNWNGYWYNYGSNVVGYTNKTVRLGFKDGQYCIVLGGAASVWSYGQVVLRKIQNGAYYTNIMDLGGTYSISQTATESFTWVTGDLTQLRTPGTFIAYGDIRAPIFYDSDNTNYYVNPASTSVLYSIAAGAAGNSSANIPALKVTSAGTATTQAAIAIQQQTSEGDTIIFCDFDQYVEWNLVHENVNNQLIVHGGSSTGNLGSNTFYSPNGTAKTGYIKHVFDMTDGNAYIGGSVGIGTNGPGQKLDVRGTIISNTDVRAPIFYDSANTTYYIDPGSTTSLRTVGSWRSDSAAWDGEFNGKIQYHANHWYFQAADLWLFRNSGGSNVVSISQGGIVNLSGITGAGNTYIQTSTTGTAYTSHFQIREANGGGGNTSEIYAPALGFHWSGVVASNILMESSGRIAIRNNPGSGYENFIANAIYGAIFYDSNDTAYYIDPASTSLLNATRHLNIVAGSNAGMTSSGQLAVYSSASPYISFHDGGVARTAYFQETGGRFYFGEVTYTESEGSFRAPVFYDSANTSYFVDPNGTSNLYYITMPHIANGTANLLVNNGGSENWNAIKVSGGNDQNGIGYSNTSHSAFGRNNFSFHVHSSDAVRFHSSGWDTLFEVAGSSGNAWLKGGLFDSGFTRLVNPGGAYYVTSTSSVTGAIKIRLPRWKVNTMMRMTVKIYQYNTGYCTTIECGGYDYQNADWYNVFAYQNGDLFGNITVRFGNDGTYDCIWIGETTDTWSYPQVFVTDFQAGFGNYSADWGTGWNVSYVTSFGTVSTSRVAYKTLNTNSTLTAGNLSGTIPSAVLGNSTVYVGTTAIALNRTSSSQTLTGISIDGNAATATVNSGNTSAAWYPIVWHSGNTHYSTANVQIYAAGGYIQANYFNSSDNDETNITRFIIKNGDNYHRSATTTSAANIIRGVASGDWSINAVNLSTTRANWSTNGTITAVVGQLCWKNYGNGHTIIDASNSTSPAGGAINNTNPDVAWTGTYPTLMGWNGTNTYGVRVDSSRYADQVGYSPSRTDSTAYPVLWGSGTSYTVAYSCAAVTIQSSTGTLNATNVNVSGKLVQNSTTQSITGTGQTLTLNVAAASVQVISMASGATITTISYTNRDNNPSVNTIMLVVKYAGSASITFTNVLWANGTAPTLTGTNGYADVFMLTSYQGGAGTPVWIGTVVAQALVSTNL